MNINVVFLTVLASIGGETFGQNATISNETLAVYNFGVNAGIVDPNKYPLESFAQHHRDIFRIAYEDFLALYEDQDEPTSYQEWLVINNYGIMPDTQESLFMKKDIARCLLNCDDYYRKQFLQTVKTGDILISGKSRGGFMGHAALMVTDYWVIEMRGGKNWKRGIENNNRQLSKQDWYRKNKSKWTVVYRCPDKEAAERAALWADRNYFNPHGGQYKSIHVNYKITTDFSCKNPSYSPKMVLQSYYYTSPGMIRDPYKYGAVIVPTSIPAYFMEPYTLQKIGKY